MTRNPIVPIALCLVAGLAAAGCGDASADDMFASKCERMCNHGDACPNLYADSDCVSSCEEAVEDAAVLGGTCPAAVDEVIACHTQLSCDDLTVRAQGGFRNDECVAKEAALNRCVAGDPAPQVEEERDDVGELALACQSLCDALDDCPNTRAEPDCLEICVDGFLGFQNGTPACGDAVVDTLNCQAGMTCSELADRVVGRGLDDACTNADRRAASLCI